MSLSSTGALQLGEVADKELSLLEVAESLVFMLENDGFKRTDKTRIRGFEGALYEDDGIEVCIETGSQEFLIHVGVPVGANAGGDFRQITFYGNRKVLVSSGPVRISGLEQLPHVTDLLRRKISRARLLIMSNPDKVVTEYADVKTGGEVDFLRDRLRETVAIATITGAWVGGAFALGYDVNDTLEYLMINHGPDFLRKYMSLLTKYIMNGGQFGEYIYDATLVGVHGAIAGIGMYVGCKVSQIREESLKRDF